MQNKINIVEIKKSIIVIEIKKSIIVILSQVIPPGLLSGRKMPNVAKLAHVTAQQRLITPQSCQWKFYQTNGDLGFCLVCHSLKHSGTCSITLHSSIRDNLLLSHLVRSAMIAEHAVASVLTLGDEVPSS